MWIAAVDSIAIDRDVCALVIGRDGKLMWPDGEIGPRDEACELPIGGGIEETDLPAHLVHHDESVLSRRTVEIRRHAGLRGRRTSPAEQNRRRGIKQSTLHGVAPVFAASCVRIMRSMTWRARTPPASMLKALSFRCGLARIERCCASSTATSSRNTAPC